MVTLQESYTKLTQSLATGINRAGERFVEDIVAQVPVRTGKLRDGYRINKQATPDSLRIQIGPSQRYGANFYPWRDDKRAFGRRQAQRPARARLFGGADPVYAKRRASIIREEIVRSLNG